MDGPNASHITPKALDRWEQRLNELFEGRPYDMYDAALSNTVSKYPVDIQVELKPQCYTASMLLYIHCTIYLVINYEPQLIANPLL